MRYSLLSLTLVLTLSAFAVSHWLTSRRLHVATTKLAEQRREIRELSHQLGQLTEEDLPYVQVRLESMSRTTPLVLSSRTPRTVSRDDPYEDFDVDWGLHVPSERKWRIYWADGDIPLQGLPAQATGFRELPSQSPNWNSFGFKFRSQGAAGVWVEFELGGDKWNYMIPSDRREWLVRDCETSLKYIGPHSYHGGGSLIEQFACDKPVVLYVERKSIVTQVTGGSIADDDPKHCQGFMVWLQPVEASGQDAGSAPR